MTIDRQPFTGELHGCAPKQRNCATLPPAPATGRATGTQPTSLKAAAARVLQRNRARNLHATEAENPRNSERATEAAEVAQVARPADPVALLAGADPDPAAHCDRCGSPGWWRSPGAGWRCSWCEPRPQPLPEGFEALTLAGGQWRAGTEPPTDPDAVTGNQAQNRTPHRPVDGRVQDAFGAWRTPAAHAAIRAFYAHHWHCDRCIRAGRGYGARCEAGARLHAATRAGR